MFLYYANEESDDVIDGSTTTAQHSIENSRNIKSSVLQTWHQQCASQKQHNDTHHAVAMTTVMHFKNQNCQEADQMAICKHDRGVEIGSTEKQLL